MIAGSPASFLMLLRQTRSFAASVRGMLVVVGVGVG